MRTLGGIVGLVAVVVAGCPRGDEPPPVVPKRDPVPYGSAGEQWIDTFTLDLGPRSRGAPSNVRSRVHAPEAWNREARTAILVPDAGIFPDEYLDVANHLASHGIITVIPQFDQVGAVRTPAQLADDLVAAMDHLREKPPVFEGIDVDTSRFALLGHGRGAQAAFLAADDARVVGAFGIDPYRVGRPALRSLRVPVGLTGAGRAVEDGGCVDAEDGYRAVFELLPAGAVLFEDPTGGHLDVLDRCADRKGGATCASCTPGDDPALSARFVRASVLAFVGRWLQEDEGYAHWLEGEDVADLVPDAVVEIKQP